MNQGVVQSSQMQQMVAAGGWTVNNIKPPSHHQHHSFAPAAAPHHHQFSHHLAPTPLTDAASWNNSLELPAESWSQLLLGGLVSEEDKPSLSHMQTKKMELWEQLMNQNSYDVIKNNNSCWSHNQMVSGSPPKSCITTLSNDAKHPHQDPSYECNSTATGGVAKKPRIQPSSAQSTFKVRKEKLGDRITALHQIVSPFGKTDTASVLLEAIGYIRFLQSQIEALSLPYLGSGSITTRQQHHIQAERNCLFQEDSGQECDEDAKKDLRSRGLCLVPVSCTLDVGSEINGADYWAPAFAAKFP